MASDDPPGEREAHPGSLELAHAVQPVEHAEELVHVLHVKADAVVADAVDRLASLDLSLDADLGPLPDRGELHGVRQEVHPDPQQQGGVPGGLGKDAHREGDPRRGAGVRHDPGKGLLRHGGHVDRRERQVGAPGLREGEEVVDQLPHPLRDPADLAERATPLGPSSSNSGSNRWAISADPLAGGGPATAGDERVDVGL